MQTYTVYVKWKLPDGTFLVRGIAESANNSEEAEQRVMRYYKTPALLKKLGRPILVVGETEEYTEEDLPRLDLKLIDLQKRGRSPEEVLNPIREEHWNPMYEEFKKEKEAKGDFSW
jgi:hypothetical protein